MEALAIVIATFFGPVAAVLITRWNDSRAQRRERRLHIFRTLMATRLVAISLDHVMAINLIEVEFDGVRGVIDAWRSYLNHLNAHPGTDASQPLQQAWEERRGDLLALLLSRIAAHLGITTGELEIRRGGYAPDAWRQRDIRLAQIIDYGARLSGGNAALPVYVLQPEPTDGDSAKEVPSTRKTRRP